MVVLFHSKLGFYNIYYLFYLFFVVDLQVLFDFLASSLQKFIEKEGKESSSSQDVKRELAFTFSFPVKQTSLSSGVLIKWTKGFAISEMVSSIFFLGLFYTCLPYKG